MSKLVLHEDSLTFDSQGKLICRPGIVVPPTGGDPFTFTTGATKAPMMNQPNPDNVFYLWDEGNEEDEEDHGGPIPIGIEIYHQPPATISETSNFEVIIPNITDIRTQDSNLIDEYFSGAIEVMLIYNDNTKTEKWIRLIEQTTGHFVLDTPNSLANIINNTNHEYLIAILKTNDPYNPLVHVDTINFYDSDKGSYGTNMLLIGNNGEHVVYNKGEFLWSNQSLPDWIESLELIQAGSAAIDSNATGKGFKGLYNHSNFYIDTPHRELPLLVYHQPPLTVNQVTNFEVIIPSAAIIRAFDDKIQNYSMQLEVALAYCSNEDEWENKTFNKITLSDDNNTGHFVLTIPNSLIGLTSFAEHGYMIIIRSAEASRIADNTDIESQIGIGFQGYFGSNGTGWFGSPGSHVGGFVPAIHPGDSVIDITSTGRLLGS